MPAGVSPPAAGRSAETTPPVRKRKASGGAGATAAARDGQVPRAARSTGNGASAKGKRKARTVQPTIFTWKSQKMGLPTEVRTELRDLLKTGKTAAERAEEAAAKAAAEAAKAAAQAAAAANAEAPAPEAPAGALNLRYCIFGLS